MKRYIVTSKKTQVEHELNEIEFDLLKTRINIHRNYTYREVPERKPVPRPKELDREVETPNPVKRVVEPKTKSND